MEMFKLENVWICRLAYVHRKRPNDIMVMEEGTRNCVLIMKEVDKSYQKVLSITGIKGYIPEQAVYSSLEGYEFYDGTQKEIFRPTDIGKIFVIERYEMPRECLTQKERESQMISEQRIKALSEKMKYYPFTV
ncbi:MAG: hypothetical protein ACI4VN_00585 [Clostridia bacterium]